MSKITDHFIPALLNLFISAAERTPQWLPETRYVEGTVVRNRARLYLAANTGFSGQSGPQHSSGKSADGSVNWYFVRDVASSDSLGGNLFLGVGDPGAWRNEPTADPEGGVEDEQKCLESLIALFRITSGDMVLGVPRRDWTSGVISEWPDDASYVTVGESVYRCISNNAGATSTVEPSGNSLTPFELADGYVWKYLGSVAISQFQRFASANAFPVPPLNNDDGSDRWIVQTVAQPGSISGFSDIQQTGVFTDPEALVLGTGTGAAARADLTVGGEIRRVVATLIGTGYLESTPAYAVVKNSTADNTEDADATATITAGEITGVTVVEAGAGYPDAVGFIIGDGVGAEIDVEVTSGYITGVTVVEPGDGYTWAEVIIIPGTAGAVARAVLAPNGGHGRSMVKELPVEYAIVNKRINPYESTFIPEGPIRQFSLLTGVQLTATGDIGVGPNHTTLQPTATLTGARVLQMSNVDTITHEDEQYEEITIALRLNK